MTPRRTTPATLYGWCNRHPECPVRIGQPEAARSESGRVAKCEVEASGCSTCGQAHGRMLDLNWFKPKREGWVPMFVAPPQNPEKNNG